MRPLVGGFAASWRLGVVVGVYAIHLALALGFAWPVTRLLADAALVHPRGDLVLFEPGATYLVEAFRLERASLTSVAEGSVLAVLATSYLGLLPLAALLHALAQAGRVTFASLVAAAGRFFGTFSLLLGLALVSTALLAFVPLTVGSLLDDKLKLVFGDRNHDIARTSFRVVALLAAALVAVVHDLARAASVARELRALDAVRLAVQVFRAFPWRALGAWGLRGTAGIALVVVVAWVTTRIGVHTGLRFGVVTVIHQAVVLSLVLLRARWLASALKLIAGVIGAKE
jgi:hypothetical protein